MRKVNLIIATFTAVLSSYVMCLATFMALRMKGLPIILCIIPAYLIGFSSAMTAEKEIRPWCRAEFTALSDAGAFRRFPDS